jgi:hypothetical protein
MSLLLLSGESVYAARVYRVGFTHREQEYENAMCIRQGWRTLMRRWRMLLNDVQPDKRLAFLLGVQIERHVFRGGFGVTVGIAILSAVAMLLALVGYYVDFP